MPRMLHENQEEFNEAVKRSNGKVVVVVHPLYHFNLQVPRSYLRALVKLRNSKATVVVLENKPNLGQTIPLFDNRNSFFVETELSSSNPVRGWDKLNRILRKAGAKTVLVGGMLAMHRRFNKPMAEIIEEHDAKLPKPPSCSITGGCVAGTYAKLIRGRHIKVRLLPELLHPQKPEY